MPAPVTTDGVWTPGRRALTLGLVFTVTLVGFEGLAVATILNVISDDLHGIGLIGWIFSAFFLGNLFGVIAAGRDADRHGPARPFVFGLVLFGLGLGAGGLAPNMGALIAAQRGAGHRRRHDPGGGVCRGRARVPARAAAPNVRGDVDCLGVARADRSGDQRRGRVGRRLAVGVPRALAVGRSCRGNDDARAGCARRARR